MSENNESTQKAANKNDLNKKDLNKKDQDVIAKIDKLFTRWAKNDSPGCAIGIVKDGHPVYLQGYGMANLEYPIPNTTKTVFHIASESKKFTVMAILLLQKQGKLSIYDDIHKYLSYVPDFGETITIKHLIQHTSGLRDQWELLIMAGWKMQDIISQKHILNLVKMQKELNFKPGEEHLYCNTGYTLLAEIVKSVSGKTLRRFTQKYIFKPLEMNQTHFHDEVAMIVPNRAYSYIPHPSGNGFQKGLLNYDNVGATSLFTTVEDMVKWDRNMDTGEVGGKDLVEQLHERTVLNNGKELSYAFGISIEKYHGLTKVGHGGADSGYRTYIARYPDVHMLIIVFCNLGSMIPQKLGHQIMDICIEEGLVQLPANVLKEIKDSKITSTSQTDKKTEESLHSDFNLEVWKEKIEGLYEISTGVLIQLKLTDDNILGRILSDESRIFVFHPVTAFSFEDSQSGLNLELQLSQENDLEGITIISGNTKINLTKHESFTLPEEDQKEYIGQYFSEELQVKYTLIQKKDQLQFVHHRIDDIPLIALQKDLFHGSMFQFRFFRNEEGQIIGFYVSSGRVRNLKFEICQ